MFVMQQHRADARFIERISCWSNFRQIGCQLVLMTGCQAPPCKGDTLTATAR